MVITEAYFENIKTELQLELSNAKTSIYVALAWFTDKDLLDTLIIKANENKDVQLLVFNDDINFGNYGLPFENLSKAGGHFFIKAENLMHNKFCIIDEHIIITGSYNWTNKANTSNHENIVIIKDDLELAKSYIDEFKKLTGTKKDTIESIAKLIKRLKVIQNLIELNDVEDIELQVERLKKDAYKDALDIITDLSNKHYYKAIEKIKLFVSQFNGLAVYIDPEIAALQLEIKLLEYQIITLDNEIAEIEKQIAGFNHQMHKRLGGLIEQLFEEKEAYFFRNKQENDKAEAEYETIKEQHEKFTNDSNEEESKIFFEIAEEEKNEIKKLFKAASMLCHPDKFENETPEIKKMAEEIFKELNAANEKNDMKTVQHIYQQLKAGILNIKIKKQENKELLKLQYESLTSKFLAKGELLTEYNESDIIKLLKDYPDLDVFFIEKEQQLQQELMYWKNKNIVSQ